MVSTTYRQSGKNNKTKMNNDIIEDSIGSDDSIEEDDYNLDAFGELVPSFDSGISTENQKTRAREFLKRME